MVAASKLAIGDWAARCAVIVVFMALAVLSGAGIANLVPIDSAHKVLMVAARVANVMFLCLVAATTVTRLTPILKSRSLQSRVLALLGTFLATTLAMFPKAELEPILTITATALTMIGSVLSFVVLRWLGKSFSILAEARRLVTGGPYRLVRHPLYICEAIALVGIMLQVISPLAVIMTLAILAIQYQRMINEEAILAAAFPEYRAYALRTPRLFPRLAALAPRAKRECAKQHHSI